MFRISFAILTLFTSAHAEPVPGFADTHNHQFAEYAFGGGWMHGHTEGAIEQALASCEIDEDHAHISIPLVSDFIGRIVGSSGDTGQHPKKHQGYPSFSGWPRWDTIAHEQVWEGHLKQAHEQGLNLFVASMVNFEPLCDLIPPANRKTNDCSDMAAVQTELEAAHRFEKNHAWFKIVTTPAEARAAILSGKLAVVLSIEVTNLFGKEDWQVGLERVYAQGVRTLQLGHQLNNRFTGVAMHNPVFRILSWLFEYRNRKHWYEALMPWRFGFHYTEDPVTHVRKNVRGLSSEGVGLIQAMMKKGMLLDLAHESEKAVKDIQALTLQNHNYPVYLSHGHFRAAMDDGKFSTWEKSSEAWVLDYIRDSGGIFGLRTGPEKTKAFENSPALNDCQGSSKSFAQTYQYGDARKLPVAFGTDLNGFIQQTRPRFGNSEETCGAETLAEDKSIQQAAQKNPLGRAFDQTGLGDVSKLPDLLQELKNFGVDTKNLETSAEHFILMWEKAQKISNIRPLGG